MVSFGLNIAILEQLDFAPRPHLATFPEHLHALLMGVQDELLFTGLASQLHLDLPLPLNSLAVTSLRLN